jgi:hypothetical protein
MTILTMTIWGAALVGYVSMLVLTERGAARYLRREAPCHAQARIHVLTADPRTPVPAARRLEREEHCTLVTEVA